MKETQTGIERVPFATHPSRYKHWKLEVEGAIAWLKMDVSEVDGGSYGCRRVL
jgi:benzoyl-CoA-dihydrodiol lyase